MKRFVTLTLLLALLTAIPARAVTWFDDGEELHRDPFCVDAAFSFDSFYTPALQLADDAEARTHGDLCESCTGLVAPAEGADTPVMWYYNPDGGKFLHRDPECASVSQKYKPMTGTVVAERPDLMPENPCSFCGSAQQVLRGPSDTFGWNATPDEKAAFLSGVWTAPSAEAVHFSIAASAATDFLQTLHPQETYVMSVAHYDHGGPDEGKNRATYKVIVTTLLRHPVCIVYVDALTGEVYHHQMAAEYEK
nr:hypothetical protein [Clostridia bacterium]